MRIDIEIKNNFAETMEKYEKNVEKGLIACGTTAERLAKENCPVHTGRLKGSITYATQNNQGTPQPPFKPPKPMNPADSAPHERPDDRTMYIGTNVHYAPKIELYDMPHVVGQAHFMRDALSDNIDDYSKLLTQALNS